MKLGRKTRRIIIGLGAFLALFVLVHTAPVKEVVRRFVVATASSLVEGRVSLDALDYRLWLGEISLTALSMEPDHMVVPFNLEIDRLQAHVSLRLKLSASARGLELVFVDFFETPSADYTPLVEWVSALDAKPGRIAFSDHDASGRLVEWLAVENVAIDISDAGDEHRTSFHSTRGHLDTGSRDITWGAIDADLSIRPGEALRFDSVSVFKDDSFVRMEGSLDFVEALEASIDLDYVLDGTLMRILDEELEVRGVVTGTGEARYRDEAIRVAARARSETLGWQDVSVSNLELDAKLEDDVLQVARLSVEGLGGSATAAARLGLGEGADQSVTLNFRGIESDELARVTLREALPIVTRVSGEASVTWTDWQMGGAQAEARLRLERSARGGPTAEGDVRLAFARDTLEIQTENLTLPELATRASLDGRVTPSGAFDVSYGVVAENLEEIGRRVAGELPVALEGSAAVDGRVSGSLTDPSWSAVVSTDGLRVEEEALRIAGRLSGDLRAAQLADVTIEGERGEIRIEGRTPLRATEAWAAKASVDSFELPALAGLAGTADGEIVVTGSGFEPDVRASLVLDPLVVFDEGPGRAELELAKEGRRFRMERVHATLAEAWFEGSGTYDLDSDAIRAEAELEGLRASDFPALSEALAGFDGRVGFQASFLGSLAEPRGSAAVRFAELELNEVPLPSLDVNVSVAPEELVLHGTWEDGATFLRGTMPIVSPYVLHLELPLDAMPIRAIAHGLLERGDVQKEWEADGALEADLPLATPSELAFTARVDRFEGETEVGPLRSSSFTVSGDFAALTIEGLELRGTYNHLAVDGRVPLGVEESFDLDITGELRLGFLSYLDPDLEIEGTANLGASISGSLEVPDVQGRFSLADGRGRWQGIAWSNLDVTAVAGEGRLQELAMSADVLGGRLVARGNTPLFEGGIPGRVDIRFEDLDVAQVLFDDERSSVVLTADGTVFVPELGLAVLTGSGEIVRLALGVGDATIENASRAAWSLRDGSFSLPELILEGPDSELSLALPSLRFVDEFGFVGNARGAVQTAFLNPLLSAAGVRVAGIAELDVAARYDHEGLSMTGTGSLQRGQFTLVDPPFRLTDAEARFQLDDSTLTIQDLEARVGNGSLEGNGVLSLEDPSAPALRLNANAEEVPLQLMDGFRTEVSGTIELRNAERGFALSGDLFLDRSLVTRELEDEDAAFSSQSIAFRDPTEEGFADRLALDLAISTRRNVRVENSTAQLELSGSLSFGGTLAAPEVGGFITVLPDGYVNVGRNRFQTVSGRADLTGFPLVPPRLDLLAVTKVGTTVIEIDIEGDADDLRTRLSSPENPDLTEGDLASLVVTGRTLEKAGEGGQQMATTWMMSSVADLFHEGLGDLISFGPPPGAGPLILSEETDPTSRLTVGFPVTEKLSITYSIALDSTERRLWILDYRLARNFWLRGIQENSNDYSIGISQRFELDFRGRRDASSRFRARDQRLAEVSVRGAPQGLDRVPDMRTGQRYDYWNAQDEARAIQKRLVELGYLSATVDVDATVTEGEGRDRVVLSFVVEPGLPTEIAFEGDDPGKDVRKLVQDGWNGRIPEEFLVTDLALQSVTHLRVHRYYQAEVRPWIEEEEGRRRAVFRTELGPRGKSVHVSFEGNEALTDEELETVLPAPNTPEFFTLLERPAELERGIRLRYASEGYLNTSLGALSKRFDRDRGELRVTIPVDEGPLSVVKDISFEGVGAFDPERLQGELGVEVGDPVDFQAIRRGQTNLRTFYRNEGFPDVRLRAELTRDVEGLDVVVRVEEGAPARIGQVRIVGNLKTKESVILNELTFRSNDPVRATEFQRTQKRLYDLGIFRSADVRPDAAHAGREIQDVLIQVVERSDIDVNYGLRYNTVGSDQSVSSETEPKKSGIEVVARLTFLNLLRQGTSFGMSVFFQGEQQLYRGTFRKPTFLGKRILTELIVDTEREQNRLGIRDFDTRVDAFTFQQTKKLTDDRLDKFAIQWNFRQAHIFGRAISEDAVIDDVDTWRPRFGFSIIEDRRDSFASPTRGRFWNLTFQAVPEIWGSDLSYFRLYGQFFFYYPLFGEVVWASGYRAGVAQGSRELLLIEDRFQAGGANSVRGFEQNTLGPSVLLPDTFEEIFVGGQAVGVFNQELRFPLWKALHGGAFWDAGNVFARAKDFRLADLRHSAGAGLRYVLSFGAIRLDWARVLDPQPGESKSRWHFSFGYAF